MDEVTLKMVPDNIITRVSPSYAPGSSNVLIIGST